MSQFPSTCGCSCGDGIKANASGAAHENGWSSITSFRSLLAVATPNETSNFCASRATDRRAQRYDHYLWPTLSSVFRPRAKSRPRFRHTKCKRPRKSRSRSREPINRYPVKVALIIGPTLPQIKLLQGGSHPVLRTLHLSLRDNLPEGRWTRRDSNPHADLDGVLCCHYTTGPRIRAYFSCDKDSGLHPAFIRVEFCFGTGFGRDGRSPSLGRGFPQRTFVTSNLGNRYLLK